MNSLSNQLHHGSKFAYHYIDRLSDVLPLSVELGASNSPHRLSRKQHRVPGPALNHSKDRLRLRIYQAFVGRANSSTWSNGQLSFNIYMSQIFQLKLFQYMFQAIAPPQILHVCEREVFYRLLVKWTHGLKNAPPSPSISHHEMNP